MKNIHSTLSAVLLGCIYNAICAIPGHSITPANYSFDAVRQALAIVETDAGVGSGFIVIIDGDKYLLTNCHVVKDAKSLSLRLIDGVDLVPLSIDIADGNDLVRFRLKNDTNLNALMLSSSSPTIHDSIVVLGNSDGRGVATELKGEILGLGPGVIEVSAGFVSGNSGSPILSKNGTILGVATYVTREAPQKDWITKGTRFEATRRFGLRVSDGMKWNRISMRQLFTQTSLISEIDEYANDLIVILACWRHYGFVENPESAFRQYAVNMKHQSPSPLRQKMNIFVTNYAKYMQDGAKYSDKSFTINSLKSAVTTSFLEVSTAARQRLKKEIWVNSDFARQAKELDELLELLYEETEKVMQDSDFWEIYKYGSGGGRVLDYHTLVKMR